MTTKQSQQPACTEKHYAITRDDLPLSCPTKNMAVWNAHPKVYLPIEETGREVCPYCGAEFTFKDALPDV